MLVCLASVMSVVAATSAALLADHGSRDWIVGALIVVTSMLAWHRIDDPATPVPARVRRG